MIEPREGRTKHESNAASLIAADQLIALEGPLHTQLQPSSHPANIKTRPFPEHFFRAFRTKIFIGTRSTGETSPLPSLNSRLLASLSTAESRPPIEMDQGDFQMPLLPVDFDIDWSLWEDDWSFG